MGLQLEFNWYLVLKKPAEKIESGPWSEELDDFITDETYFRTYKSDARIYPVGGVVPIIIDDTAIGLAYIREVSQRLDHKNKIMTVIDFDQLMEFKEGDPVGVHYTDMYAAYKKKQEIEDHGGKFKTDDFLNALERRNFDRALKEAGYEQT